MWEVKYRYDRGSTSVLGGGEREAWVTDTAYV